MSFFLVRQALGEIFLVKHFWEMNKITTDKSDDLISPNCVKTSYVTKIVKFACGRLLHTLRNPGTADLAEICFH